MSPRTLAAALAAALLAPALAAADTIRLKNGNTFDGTVESRTDKEIRINTDGAIISFRPDEVLSITESTPFSSSATVSDSSQKRQSKRGLLMKKIGKERRAGRRRTAGAAKVGDQEVALPSFNTENLWFSPSNKTGQEIYAKIGELGSLGVPALTGILFVLLFHLVCIYGVAKKIGASPAWFAFVPGLNLVLLCWMGGMPWWWLIPLTLAAGFHPVVAVAANVLFFFVFIGPGIASACQKKWWIGPLLFLYPLAILVWVWLAFSPERKKQKVVLPPGFKLPT